MKDIIHTALRAVIDGTDRGDLKILSRALPRAEVRVQGLRAVQGQAEDLDLRLRLTSEGEPIYAYAAEFGKRIADAGVHGHHWRRGGSWRRVTGAGRDRSFGLNIRPPFEQAPNEVIENDPKLILFHYFFTRKLFFVKEADGLVFSPAGSERTTRRTSR